MAELNLKELIFPESADELMTLVARPNYRALGPVFQKGDGPKVLLDAVDALVKAGQMAGGRGAGGVDSAWRGVFEGDFAMMHESLQKLAGLPPEVPGCTVNRLCSSGLNAVGMAANAIRAGEADLIIAGGVESMSRAPFVIGKANGPFDRSPKMEDTTMGWRFVNRKLEAMHGTETMPKTAENLADEFNISREDQDRYAAASYERAAAAISGGRFNDQIVPVSIPQRKGDDLLFETAMKTKFKPTSR